MRWLICLTFWVSALSACAAPYLGDYAEDETLHFSWNTTDSNGASITRATDGTVWVYKDNATGTEVQTGVTDTEDFDSLTGIHACTVDLSSAAFYAVGADYTVVLKAATIDGQTVNRALAHFSIENRFAEVDVTKWTGTAVATPATPGYVYATIKDGTGTGEIDTASGYVRTSYSWSNGFFTVTMTADAGSDADTLVDAALTPTDPAYDDYYADRYLLMTGGNNFGLARRIISYDAAATTLEVSPAFPFAIVATDSYNILWTPAPPIDANELIAGTVTSVTNRVTANVDQIAGSANAATQLSRSALTIVSGTVDSTAVAPTATVFESDDITEATADHYIGRLIIFTGGVLTNQVTTITDYELSGGRGKFTVSTLTEAPANNDTFIIL